MRASSRAFTKGQSEPAGIVIGATVYLTKMEMVLYPHGMYGETQVQAWGDQNKAQICKVSHKNLTKDLTY